ncbi:MOSC N-terminal [Glarea lozoyensis ATCC 20868]|uniref:MOSC N-terminal n=1 Tax=Glarea lozoyensis (strain ATCC 20868 / MF5171) TaxID=1116229 RepID=S3DB20_GLAL2|nr:MOSC N-terminal [Glarea lozoyensis ATCC 20868]EPE34935.1 MOSC N-terminal [Glarea lozoyensis ATCC 20868]
MPDLLDWTSHQHQGILVGGACTLIYLVSYFFFGQQPTRKISGKAARAFQLRQAFDRIKKKQDVKPLIQDNVDSPEMLKVKQLWIYPIKSLRGCSVQQAMLTNEGFYHDRRFMLLKKSDDTSETLENMHIAKFASMSLFHPSISGEKLLVSYRSPGTEEPTGEVLELDLHPNTKGLETVDVNMHRSPTTGYNMGSKANEWFSSRFGFDVVLAFWGDNPRLALGNIPGKPYGYSPKPKSSLSQAISQIPLVGSLMQDEENDKIAFNDCAPYLVINQSSVDEVSSRLSEDTSMDLTKFRSNIVLSSPSLREWEEDYWASIEFPTLDARIILTGNCGRCASLNVDYNMGQPGKGKEGEILKLMQKDRRVDEGMKYSPIFGRYGFVSKGGEGKVVKVGDVCRIGERNESGTTFYWPGLSTGTR